jgi:UrcA family protein
MALKARMLLYVAATVASAAIYAADGASGDVHQSATVYAPEDQGELRHSTTVRLEGVNFHRPRDVAALYDRITYAVNQVCGPRSLTGSFYTSPGYVRCYADAMNEAVARVNHSELTNYHLERLARSAHLASK